jgi:DNA-binding NtrC family response regulator
LVEDEDSLRSVVAKILRKKEFEVFEAPNGTAAIDLLKSEGAHVGVVLLDVTLPGISGAELYDELRRIRPEMKVILSTAYTSETAMREFRGRDIWAFIRKPYRTEELVQLLHRAANGGHIN